MKCFYHSADLDGHCSGAIVKYHNPSVELIPINYGDPFPWDTIGKNEIVYMVDFSLQPFNQMAKLNDLCQLVWIDHHESAISDYHDYDGAIEGRRAVNKAACQICWEYMSGEPVPEAIRLLSKYDIWQLKDPKVLPFQYGCRLRHTDPREDLNLSWWVSIFKDNKLCNSIRHDGLMILQYEEATNRKYLEAYGHAVSWTVDLPATPLLGKGRMYLHCYAVNKGLTSSKLFDSLPDKDRYDVWITYCQRPDGRYTVSLYSEQTDVSIIAHAMGGGGHKGASGFQCDKLPWR